MDSFLTYYIDQSFKSRVNVLHPAISLPMPLGREIDYITRVREASQIVHEHLSRAYFTPVTGSFVVLEVTRECFPKLKRNSPTHDANTIDCVHQRFNVGLDNVATC
jgi:hypothetical protein